MTYRRGLHWLALATLLGTGCDKTLSFDVPAAAQDGGEPGAGGTAGGAGLGFGGSLVGEGGSGWHKGGSPGNSAGGTFFGGESCGSFCERVGQHCPDSEESCVECLKDEHCPPGLYCDGYLNRCVLCRGDDGCPDDMWCDNYGQCRESCLTASHPDRTCRDETQVCDERRNVCITCRQHEHCEGSPDGRYCHRSGARCVQCVSDDDCGREKPHCDPVLSRCVECQDSWDCKLPSVCDPELHVCYDSRFGVPFPT